MSATPLQPRVGHPRFAQRRFGSIAPSGRGVVASALHPAHRTGRTMFPSRVFDPDEVGRVLKSGHNSRKIGKTVAKGKWKGFPIFTLTLEERATCPRSCAVWGACYGNNMQVAERIVAGPPLEQALGHELAALQARHPSGFAVRLHVLGDFYSVEYVDFWASALDRFPALHIFGFTARKPVTDPIGAALLALASDRWARFAVRFSGQDWSSKAARLHDSSEGTAAAARGVPAPQPSAIVCPAQRALTDCCATCALCWQSDRTIAFLRH